MGINKRTHRQRFRAFWSGSDWRSSSTTDDIPPLSAPNTAQVPPRLTRHATQPLPAHFSAPSLPITSPVANILADATTMAANATIIFSQPGVQPPVYVVTSLSEPPWEILEMFVDEQQPESENLVFKRTFQNVSKGSYQYKIRIGEGHWVVDESKESAADEHGNRNNVVRAEPIHDVDSTNGHLGTEMSEPENAQPETSSQVKLPAPSEVPTIIVEKTDSQPVHGDDFGEKATSTQKAAHELRAADASPDKIVVPAEAHETSVTGELETAPLFGHENEPNNSSTHQSTSRDTTNLSSNHGELNDSGGGQSSSYVDTGLLFSYEAGEDGDNDSYDELSHGPLLSHETGLNGGIAGHVATEDEGELDAAPLLPHETGFAQHHEDGVTTNSSSTTGEDGSEPRHYAYDDDDELDEQLSFGRRNSTNGDPGYDENDVPLLPHERDSAVISQSGSELGEEGALTSPRYSTIEGESGSAKELFGRPPMFRARTNSSTLPHKLPRSDAEDENLLDPSLERFPTDREQILQRVATIGLHLPEDQTLEDSVHSPVLSVLSQACSSVDLVPVKSYASLASVPEADNSDEDEEDDADAESLSSPIALNTRRVTGSARSHPEELDALKTQVSETESAERAKKSKDVDLSELKGDSAPVSDTSNLSTSASAMLDQSNPSTVGSTSQPEAQKYQASKEEKDHGSPAVPLTSEKGAADNKVTRTSTAVVIAGIAIAAYYFLGTA